MSGLQWVVDGYALALASLMLAGGAIGDLHGHKRVVLAGLAVFGAGSLACGVAPTTTALVAARVVQGVAAAFLLPGTLAIITHAFPEQREQARAIGVWAGVGSIALPAGPLLGGALIEAVGWRGRVPREPADRGRRIRGRRPRHPRERRPGRTAAGPRRHRPRRARPRRGHLRVR